MIATKTINYTVLDSEALKTEICSLAGISDGEYCDMQFDTAFEYLSLFLPSISQTEWISEITKSKVFWSWWVRNWEARDKRYLEEGGIYHEIHSAKILCDTMKMHGRLLSHSYDVMMTQLIAKEVTHAT